jgi:hypothetical protein
VPRDAVSYSHQAAGSLVMSSEFGAKLVFNVEPYKYPSFNSSRLAYYMDRCGPDNVSALPLLIRRKRMVGNHRIKGVR